MLTLNRTNLRWQGRRVYQSQSGRYFVKATPCKIYPLVQNGNFTPIADVTSPDVEVHRAGQERNFYIAQGRASE